MTKYTRNNAGIDTARKLIADGSFDVETEWSDAAPDSDEENDFINREGYEGYGRWHLAIDTEASEDTKDRFGFPFGDFSKVNRAALIHAKQRASQNDHSVIVEVADDLLEALGDSAGV